MGVQNNNFNSNSNNYSDTDWNKGYSPVSSYTAPLGNLSQYGQQGSNYNLGSMNYMLGSSPAGTNGSLGGLSAINIAPRALKGASNVAAGAMSTGTGSYAPATSGGGGLFDSFLQQEDGSGGYGAVGIGLAQGAAQAYFATQQLKNAKDTLKFNKEQFAKNWGAQTKSYNADIRDRQDARNSRGDGYQDTESYVNQNKIT